MELLVNYDLGAGIVNLIEENPEDPYIETNQSMNNSIYYNRGLGIVKFKIEIDIYK